MVIRLMTVLLLNYQALIVSLFNRSELDCLFVSLDWTRHPGPAGGGGEVRPSFILPVIRTQACHALVVVMAVVIVPKLLIIFVAGTSQASL